MNRRALGILLGALAALAVVIAIGSLAGRGKGPRDEAFLPELKAALGDVSRIVVTGPGPRVVATINRDDGRWVVAEAGNYPADVVRLRQLLQALADGRRLEEKRRPPTFTTAWASPTPGPPARVPYSSTSRRRSRSPA